MSVEEERVQLAFRRRGLLANVHQGDLCRFIGIGIGGWFAREEKTVGRMVESDFPVGEEPRGNAHHGPEATR